MNIIAKLPTKPHLKKYAYWLEGCQPIDLSSNLLLASFIRNSLVGKASLVPIDEKPFVIYSDSLELKLNSKNIERGKMFFNRKSITSINSMLHYLFLQDLLSQALFLKKYNVYYRDSIKIFCEEVGIDLELDIASQTLYKQFNRYKLQKKRAVSMA